MNRSRLLMLAATLRLLLYGSACTVATAPARPLHPMLADQGGAPHTAPLATVRRPSFDGNPGDRADDARTEELRAQVASAARGYVGQRKLKALGRALPFDCSGLARATYLQLGIDLMDVEPKRGENGVSAIYRYARRHGIVYKRGRPAIGDLVFFHDTYDRNRNGRRDDPLTHIGVVERVQDDGTVTVVHTVSRGVLRYRMNLRFPDRLRDPGGKHRVNHILRRAEGSRPSKTTASLFAGYATIIHHASVVDDGRRVAAR